MSAKVQQVEEYEAYCTECDWWSEVFDGPERAQVEANVHDREHHGGAR